MEEIVKQFKNFGIDEAAVIPVSEIPFCEDLRKLCENNACGNYKKSWMCPPLIGTFEETCARSQRYDIAVVCKSVHKIEDSFDIDGMNEALLHHKNICRKISASLSGDFMRLSAGGCDECIVCAAKTGEKCRLPERSHASPEAYAIDVTALSQLVGMEYRDGENEVAYFDIFLLQKK